MKNLDFLIYKLIKIKSNKHCNILTKIGIMIGNLKVALIALDIQRSLGEWEKQFKNTFVPSIKHMRTKEGMKVK